MHLRASSKPLLRVALPLLTENDFELHFASSCQIASNLKGQKSGWYNFYVLEAFNMK